jgi:ribulose-phosphate 3-epimerase
MVLVARHIRYINDFVEVGADIITVHAEACKHLDRTIDLIKEKGLLAGVAISPATPVSSIVPVLGKVDMVLIMSVNPGFGGQKLIPYTLDKIRELKKIVDQKGLKVDIEVDGGVTLENVEQVLEAGANVIVAGSAVFNGEADENVRCFLDILNS